MRRLSIATGMAVLLCFPAGAAAAAENSVPVPRQKPAHGLDSRARPVPRPKPDTAARPAPAPEETAPRPGSAWPPASVAAETAACSARLAGLALTWKALAPIGGPDGCGTPAPVELSAVAGVAISPPATVSCAMAEALHGWVTGSVQPAAARHLEAKVTVIHNAASYVCRGRNNQAGARMSEHGRANALDISSFSFAGAAGAVVGEGWGSLLEKPGVSKPGAFMESIRSGACASFATVLSPGSDVYHGDHFHVDAIARKNGYRICQ